MACNPQIANIRKACDTAGNAAGVRGTVRLSPVGHVATVPAPDAGTYDITTDITMETDIDGALTPGTFFEWENSEIGSNYSFEPEGEEEDGYGTHILTVFMPKMSSNKNRILDEAKGGKEFVVSFNDQNEVPWLMGDHKKGATVSATPGTDVNGRNGYNVVMRYRSAKNLYRYTGVFTVAADPA